MLGGGFGRPADFPLGRTCRVDDIPGIVELTIPAQHLVTATQGGAVGMEPVTDHGADILLDIAEAVDAHRAKDTEPLALQVLEHGTGILPVVSVRRSPCG